MAASELKPVHGPTPSLPSRKRVIQKGTRPRTPNPTDAPIPPWFPVEGHTGTRQAFVCRGVSWPIPIFLATKRKTSQLRPDSPKQFRAFSGEHSRERWWLYGVGSMVLKARRATTLHVPVPSSSAYVHTCRLPIHSQQDRPNKSTRESARSRPNIYLGAASDWVH